MTQYVNWVLDADIRSFFDSVDHEWMLRMVAHRVADRRLLRLIGQWLRAGVMEGLAGRRAGWRRPRGGGAYPPSGPSVLRLRGGPRRQRWTGSAGAARA